MSDLSQQAETDEQCAIWGFPIGTINSNSKDDIQSIYKSLECPVCHEFPESGAIYSCEENRHMICEKCLPSDNTCPGCSGAILQERSYSAEKCIANFLIPCKYKFDGCPYIIRGKEIREHVRNCNYRPIICFMAKCDDSIPFNSLFDHLFEKHSTKVNGVRDTNKQVIEWWMEGQMPKGCRWPPYFLTCFDNAFLYMSVSTSHGNWEWVWILANDEEAKRFRVEAKMESVDKLISLQWRGPVHSIRTSLTEIVKTGQVFITNSKEILNPFLFSKGGTDDRSYWRTDVTIHQVSPRIPTSVPFMVTNDPDKSNVSNIIDSWTYTTQTYPGNLTLSNEEAAREGLETHATNSSGPSKSHEESSMQLTNKSKVSFKDEDLITEFTASDIQTSGNSQSQSELIRNASVQTEPKRNLTEQSDPKRNSTGQSEPKRNSTGQPDPKRNSTEQSDPKRNSTGQSDPKRNSTGQSDPKRNSTGQSDPKRNSTGQSDPKRNSTGQSDPKRNSTGQSEPKRDSGKKSQPDITQRSVSNFKIHSSQSQKEDNDEDVYDGQESALSAAFTSSQDDRLLRREKGGNLTEYESENNMDSTTATSSKNIDNSLVSSKEVAGIINGEESEYYLRFEDNTEESVINEDEIDTEVTSVTSSDQQSRRSSK